MKLNAELLTDDGLSLSHRNFNQLKVTLQINESMNRMHKLWPSLNLPNHLLDQLVDQVVDHLVDHMVDQLVDQPAWMPHGHDSQHHHHHQHECPMVTVQVTIRQADWPTLQRKFGSFWQQSPFNVCSCSVSRQINCKHNVKEGAAMVQYVDCTACPNPYALVATRSCGWP